MQYPRFLSSRTGPVLGLSLLLGACAPPQALRGEFPKLTPTEASALKAPPEGQKVRWGGVVLSMDNKAEQSCFEILARPLDSSSRPKQSDRNDGRFLACIPGFRDPKAYEGGREVTVVGTLSGSESRQIGEYPYQYPKVAATEVYLWPKPSPEQVVVGADFLYGYPYYYAYPVYYVRREPAAPTGALSSPAPAAPRREVPMSAPAISLPSPGRPRF
ncbi:MAG: hypothetical protein EPN60_01400 [Nevskiaceae bacterium]|nr:MAG: hypothetical protein EPO48_00455 [Nevskiaceae bacterium]TAM33420.1 MAG: hypothetical protein EPN60_01400 [Nevskiaceae bacterium]